MPPLHEPISIALFGDCTVDVHLPPAMRPEAHLRVRLERAFPGQKFTIRNLGDSGGDLPSLLLHLSSVIAQLPTLDYAFILYGINDRKRQGIEECIENLQALCDKLIEFYPAAQLFLETGIWVDYPAHYAWDRNAVLGPLYEQMRQLGYPVVDIYARMQQETAKGNWDLRIRGKPEYQCQVLDDSFDQFYGDDVNWFTNIHPNSRCLGLIADWEVEMLAGYLTESAEYA